MMVFVYGLLGLVIGSFLNVVSDRAPTAESLWRAPSHCPVCGRCLSPWEMVPVWSYIRLGGRCRTCGATIPIRVLCLEAITGLFFALLWWVYGPSLRLALSTIYTCIMLVVLVIDLEHRLVLNVIILPATALALLAIPLQGLLSPPPYSYYGLLQLLGVIRLPVPALSAISQLLGGLVAFGVFLLIWLVAPRGMGAGDVKLAGFTGLITAFPGAVAAVLGSFILGGIVGVTLLATGLARRKTAIPFAPFLIITTFPVMVWGDQLLAWYLGR